MIGIDTNLLVRFITRDDARQTELVLELFEQHKGKSKSIYINVITLCELVWVLNRGYHYSKSQIIAALDLLFLVDEFKLEHPKSVQEAFVLYKTGKADFSDYVSFCINKNCGCFVTYSFDKKVVDESLFALCDPSKTHEQTLEFLEQQEDLYLSKIADSLDRDNEKTYSHSEAWK